MIAKQYATFYKVPMELVPLMEKLHPHYWYLFSSKKLINTGEKNIILCTGYYSGCGANSQRVDLTPIVTRACVDAGFMFKAYNDSKRGGVKGQKVKVYYQDKTIENNNQPIYGKSGTLVQA